MKRHKNRYQYTNWYQCLWRIHIAVWEYVLPLLPPTTAIAITVLGMTRTTFPDAPFVLRLLVWLAISILGAAVLQVLLLILWTIQEVRYYEIDFPLFPGEIEIMKTFYRNDKNNH